MPTIREAAVAGMFYPGLPGVLNRDLELLLNNAQPRTPPGTLRALIVPHAGYMYSGSTAAMGYKLLLSQNFDSVVIVGPSHREYFDGISIYPGDAYRTPLGNIQVDTSLRDVLLKTSEKIVSSNLGHRTEHAIEVQLPFLQKTLHHFIFLPVIMGNQRKDYCQLLTDALVKAIAHKNVLLIASSDLSHYHPHDFAVGLDRKVIEHVESFNAEGLMDCLERQEVEACGGGPMVVVMKTAQHLGANRSTVLQYCTSGDITGERDAVVGYCSAAFTGVN